MKPLSPSQNEQLADGGQFVLGTIGGIRGIRKSDATLDEILATIEEQARVLLAGNPDGLYLKLIMILKN